MNKHEPNYRLIEDERLKVTVIRKYLGDTPTDHCPKVYRWSEYGRLGAYTQAANLVRRMNPIQIR